MRRRGDVAVLDRSVPLVVLLHVENVASLVRQDEGSVIERDAVFSQISLCLALVPLEILVEPHRLCHLTILPLTAALKSAATARASKRSTASAASSRQHASIRRANAAKSRIEVIRGLMPTAYRQSV